jgi:hypothetical protein
MYLIQSFHFSLYQIDTYVSLRYLSILGPVYAGILNLLNYVPIHKFPYESIEWRSDIQIAQI